MLERTREAYQQNNTLWYKILEKSQDDNVQFSISQTTSSAEQGELRLNKGVSQDSSCTTFIHQDAEQDSQNGDTETWAE